MSFIPNPNYSFTPFKELRITERRSIIDIENLFGLSVLRIASSSVGSSTLTSVSSETLLQTGESTGSTLHIRSKKRMKYVAGYTSEFGVGIRTSGSLSGDQERKWGLYDDNNGFGFGEDVTGKFIFILRDGTETKVYQSNWNVETLSGTLDFENGIICQGHYTWYGYGTIEFGFITNQDVSENKRFFTPVHRFNVTGSNSVQNPNLPVRAEVTNGSTAANTALFVGGMSATNAGAENTQFRSGFQFVSGVTVPTYAFVPVVSLTKRDLINGVNNTSNIFFREIDIQTDQDVLYKVLYDPSVLSSSSFVTPADWIASETGVLYDETATQVTGGFAFDGGIIAAGTSGRNSVPQNRTDLIQAPLDSDDVITVAVKAISIEADVTVGIKWVEEW